MFDDWLHVVSDPMVARVYAGKDRDEQHRFRSDLVEMLRVQLSLTLTCINDNHTLSCNQINVSVSAMSQTLHALGAWICRVSFFGIKWRLTEAETIFDYVIDKYRAKMRAYVHDYGVHMRINSHFCSILIYKTVKNRLSLC